MPTQSAAQKIVSGYLADAPAATAIVQRHLAAVRAGRPAPSVGILTALAEVGLVAYDANAQGPLWTLTPIGDLLAA